MAAPPVLHAVVRSLCKDEREVLSDVEIEVGAGEHWAVLGPNGSGKTSLLRILCGYDWPSDGEVTVLGETFGRVELAKLRKRIGAVSAAIDVKIPARDAALAVVLSGLEAWFGLHRRFDDGERARAREALAAVAAEHLAPRPFGVLSQGERQRVLIARAIVGRPSLLVLDEPCAGLDPVARASFLADVARLVASPFAPSILFVSHHVEEIPPFVRHALLLSEGRVVARGPIDGVLTDALVSLAYGAPCRVVRDGEHLSLRVERPAPRAG